MCYFWYFFQNSNLFVSFIRCLSLRILQTSRFLNMKINSMQWRRKKIFCTDWYKARSHLKNAKQTINYFAYVPHIKSFERCHKIIDSYLKSKRHFNQRSSSGQIDVYAMPWGTTTFGETQQYADEGGILQVLSK